MDPLQNYSLMLRRPWASPPPYRRLSCHSRFSICTSYRADQRKSIGRQSTMKGAGESYEGRQELPIASAFSFFSLGYLILYGSFQTRSVDQPPRPLPRHDHLAQPSKFPEARNFCCSDYGPRASVAWLIKLNAVGGGLCGK